MDLNCTFSIEDKWRPSHYKASINAANITKEGSIVKSIRGTHIVGKSDVDVTFLEFRYTTVNFFPNGLAKIFPRLEILWINSCELKQVTAKDLDGLENLLELAIFGNSITSLPSNLLKNMKKLESFFCHSNELQYLSAKLLSYENAHLLDVVSFKNNKSIDLHFPDDCSTLNELKDAITLSCSPPQMEIEKFTKNLKVVEKFWHLWTSGNFSDFTIESGDKEFKVHKSILVIYSSVLAKAVQIDMEESKTNKMRIDDFSSDAVEEFLEFFYTGEVSEVNAMEVFALAAKYDVPELESILESIVAENVDEENALKVLTLGNLHNSETIMKKAFEMIKTLLSDIELPDEMMNKPEDLLDLLEGKQKHILEIGAANEKYKKLIDEKIHKN